MDALVTGEDVQNRSGIQEPSGLSFNFNRAGCALSIICMTSPNLPGWIPPDLPRGLAAMNCSFNRARRSLGTESVMENVRFNDAIWCLLLPGGFEMSCAVLCCSLLCYPNYPLCSPSALSAGSSLCSPFHHCNPSRSLNSLGI